MSWYTPTPTHSQNITDSCDIHFTFKFDEDDPTPKGKKNLLKILGNKKDQQQQQKQH